MKTLVLVHGYARSGKTTLLKALADRGYKVVSTSVELDWIVIESHNLPRYFVEVLQDKDDKTLQDYLKDENITCRDLKIHTAENEFIPKYGREALIRRAFNNQLNLNGEVGLVFFETVGGEEARLTRKVAKELGFKSILSIDVRRDTEIKGVDIRKLSDQHQFVNNGFDISESASQFLSKSYRLALDEATNGE